MNLAVLPMLSSRSFYCWGGGWEFSALVAGVCECVGVCLDNKVRTIKHVGNSTGRSFPDEPPPDGVERLKKKIWELLWRQQWAVLLRSRWRAPSNISMNTLDMMHWFSWIKDQTASSLCSRPFLLQLHLMGPLLTLHYLKGCHWPITIGC